MLSKFGQTLLESRKGKTDALVTLSHELTNIISRNEFEDLNQFVFENILEVDGHARMLSRVSTLYHYYRPTLTIETEKRFFTHLANALERDFDFMPCKFLNCSLKKIVLYSHTFRYFSVRKLFPTVSRLFSRLKKLKSHE